MYPMRLICLNLPTQTTHNYPPKLPQHECQMPYFVMPIAEHEGAIWASTFGPVNNRSWGDFFQWLQTILTNVVVTIWASIDSEIWGHVMCDNFGVYKSGHTYCVCTIRDHVGRNWGKECNRNLSIDNESIVNHSLGLFGTHMWRNSVGLVGTFIVTNWRHIDQTSHPISHDSLNQITSNCLRSFTTIHMLVMNSLTYPNWQKSDWTPSALW